MGSVEDPSEGAFLAEGVDLGERRGGFRFDAGGLLRGAMTAVDASRPSRRRFLYFDPEEVVLL